MNSKFDIYFFLINTFPAFESVWKSEDNYNIEEDGSYTLCGLWAEFSQFYIERYSGFSTESIGKLFEEIESILTSQDSLILDDIKSAIKSCFLENISRTASGEFSQRFMKQETKCFFMKWHIYP